MQETQRLSEDWKVIQSLLPADWEDLAKTTGSVERLRGHQTVGNLLRSLLLHVGKGYSLRETAAKTKASGLGVISDVALMKRLKKSEKWLNAMCKGLIKENQISIDNIDKNIRLFDATMITEPGKTGSQWRIHYSIQLKTFECDSFNIMPARGKGTAESFSRYSIKAGDYIIGDRAYGVRPEVGYVHDKGAYVLVRAHMNGLCLEDEHGKKFDILDKLRGTKTGECTSCEVYVSTKFGRVKGRLCAIKKTKSQIEKSLRRAKKAASKKQKELSDDSKEYAKYIALFTTLFTTFPEDSYSTEDILNLYRCRWQIELIFKRFKSIAQLGHLPKKDPKASKAWLYAKLLLALLVQKFIQVSESFSPWGYMLHTQSTSA